MSLTRKVLDDCMKVAIADTESAPVDGMLKYLIEQRNISDNFIIREMEIVAIAYYRAMVIYTRP